MAVKIHYFDVPNQLSMAMVKFESGKFAPVCGKCQGQGFIKYFAYHDEGICYDCSGDGYKQKFFENEEAVKVYCQKKAVRMAKAEAKEQAEQAKRMAEWEAGRAEREAEEQRVQAEREAEASKFTYIEASVGEIVEFTGEVKVAVEIDGNYGWQMLVIIENDQNQQFKFYSTAKWVWGVAVGDKVTVKAEFAGWSEYQGVKQNNVKKAKQVA
jgi:hypothetical protein